MTDLDKNIIKKVKIVNRRGLHARCAAKIAKYSESFMANVTISCSGISVSSRSIMALMMLGAHKGKVVQLSAYGKDAEVAVKTLVNLIEGGFGENDC